MATDMDDGDDGVRVSAASAIANAARLPTPTLPLR
jgi:hypothetical protein